MSTPAGGDIWVSVIPVTNEIPENYPNLRPHVMLDAAGELDIVGGPHQPANREANACVWVPYKQGDPTKGLSKDGVIVCDTLRTGLGPDTLDLQSAQRFWEREELRAVRISDEVAAAFGGVLLMSTAPEDIEATLDGYRFEITPQGIVLATLRTLVQRHYFFNPRTGEQSRRS